ncbi:MAG: hypothetical protein J5769_04790 [Bacteroidales bacterium]|nr:hypothetical protein [Bacteroidales bacterium]
MTPNLCFCQLGVKNGAKMTPNPVICQLGVKNGLEMTPNSWICRLGVKNGLEMTPNSWICRLGVKNGLEMTPSRCICPPGAPEGTLPDTFGRSDCAQASGGQFSSANRGETYISPRRFDGRKLPSVIWDVGVTGTNFGK